MLKDSCDAQDGAAQELKRNSEMGYSVVKYLYNIISDNS